MAIELHAIVIGDEWRFESVSGNPAAAVVHFSVEYQFRNPFMGAVASTFEKQVIQHMQPLFMQRALKLHRSELQEGREDGSDERDSFVSLVSTALRYNPASSSKMVCILIL